MEDLRRWLDRTLQNLSAKSDMAGAIRYALAHWTALRRYLEDGTIEIDNNAAERALRVVALGRKSYLFAGSNRGRERAAAIDSLLGTVKLSGVNPSGVNPSAISDTSSPTSQTTRSTALQSSCPGT
jgi:transposase